LHHIAPHWCAPSTSHANAQVFTKELVVGIVLIAAGVYGYFVGTSWVFTVYFATQGIIFVLFALSLVEAFNLQPPSEAKLLGLPEKGSEASQQPKPKRPKPKKPKRPPKKRQGYASVTADDLDDEMELDEFELGSISRNGNGHPHANGALSPAEEEEEEEEEEGEGRPVATRSRVRPPPPPSLLRVLRANGVQLDSHPHAHAHAHAHAHVHVHVHVHIHVHVSTMHHCPLSLLTMNSHVHVLTCALTVHCPLTLPADCPLTADSLRCMCSHHLPLHAAHQLLLHRAPLRRRDHGPL
jgi:hypothetical protein